MADSDKDEGKSEDEKVLDEARKRFTRAEEWENSARQNFTSDTKFCEGDSYNNFQWEDAIYSSRNGQDKPCLTINKTRQHCLQIVNDQRQNKAQIEVRPVGGGATFEAAKVFEGVVRHIEYRSNAMEAYDAAAWRQVTGGWGYWRIETDYVDADSFEQDIFIRRIADPLSIYLDPDIREFDGSDAKFGFVFKDVTREEFERDFPEYKDDPDTHGEATVLADLDESRLSPIKDWDDRDHVRMCEYFRKSDKGDTLYLIDYGNGEKPSVVRKSEMPPGAINHLPTMARIVSERETKRAEVEWFKIVGRKIVDRSIWPGSYIPLVRVIGEETVIDGKLDRKGHTRALRDPQLMYNYHSSCAVEHVALQGKTPWVTPAKAIEGLETYWSDANIENRAYLPYKHIDEDGKPIPPPQKMPPPAVPAAYIELLRNAQNEMMMVTGQYQSQFGENENAKSGVAIQTRQRQGDNATYHYIDHLAQAIRFTGRILIDLIPKIYDSERVIKIMAEDGTQTDVTIDPTAPVPHQLGMAGPNGGPPMPLSPEQAERAQQDKATADRVQAIFNPMVGTYFVEADIGPAYATRRQETFNALTQIISQSPDLMKVVGDLLFKAADFPSADDIAERLKRLVPPQVLGAGPPPEVAQIQQQAQQHVGAIQQALTQALAENQALKAKQGDKDAETDVKTYDAETRRLAAVGSIDPESLKLIVRSMVSELIQMPAVPAMAAHASAEQSMASVVPTPPAPVPPMPQGLQ